MRIIGNRFQLSVRMVPEERASPMRCAVSRLDRYPRNFPSLMMRSEEHTSELQSRLHLVCRLLLEKKHLQRTTGEAAGRYILLGASIAVIGLPGSGGRLLAFAPAGEAAVIRPLRSPGVVPRLPRTR